MFRAGAGAEIFDELELEQQKQSLKNFKRDFRLIKYFQWAMKPRQDYVTLGKIQANYFNHFRILRYRNKCSWQINAQMHITNTVPVPVMH
jgi:hypothetical protein